jgi:hypothetical protein
LPRPQAFVFKNLPILVFKLTPLLSVIVRYWSGSKPPGFYGSIQVRLPMSGDGKILGVKSQVVFLHLEIKIFLCLLQNAFSFT